MRKLCLVFTALLMLLSFTGCRVGTVDTKELIADYLEANKERMRMSSSLSHDMKEYFSAYNGGKSEVLRYDPLGFGAITGTCDTYDVYYWLDEEGSATPEYAAKALVAVMLDNVNISKSTFTITDYSVKEQKLYAWEDIPVELAKLNLFAEADGDAKTVDSLLKDDAEEYHSPFEWYAYSIALGDNMWAFDPELTFEYEGLANMYFRDEIEASDLIADDGLIKEYQQGEEGEFIHILMRYGNTWRMQRAPALNLMFG